MGVSSIEERVRCIADSQISTRGSKGNDTKHDDTKHTDTDA